MSRGYVYALEILYWLGRGRRGRRGRSRGIGQAPPVFDQQAFTEAVGITAAAITQAGMPGRQEGPSNL